MNTKITMTLSKEEVATAVEEYLVRNGYKPINNFRFNFGVRTEGYGMAETDTPYFDGCTVEVETVLPRRC